MMRFANSQSCYCLFLAALVAGCLISVEPAWSQNPATRVSTGGELLTIDKDWDKDGKDEARLFEDMRKGDEAVTEDRKAVLDNGAKWFAYRLTMPQFQDSSSGGKSMADLLKQAQVQILNPYDTRTQLNANRQAFAEEFGKRFVARLDEVSRNRKDIARLNAAMLLSQLAATGVEEAADVLAKIILDPGENDGVKFYAFRGLKEMFSLGRADNTSAFKKKEHEAACVEALITYLTRPLSLRPGITPQEIAAINYVRAEALAALGQTRLPAKTLRVGRKVTIDPKTATALLLLKEVRRDGVPIQPSLTEQVSAAVAVCHLKSNLCDEYQPDYVAYQLGQFIAEFVQLYNTADKQMISKQDKKGDKQEITIRRELWKIHAARLHQALDELKADTERYAEAKYIAKLVSQAQGVLAKVVDSVGPTPVEVQFLQGLTAFLDENPSKNKTVYKDDGTARITSQPEK